MLIVYVKINCLVFYDYTNICLQICKYIFTFIQICFYIYTNIILLHVAACLLHNSRYMILFMCLIY